MYVCTIKIIPTLQAVLSVIIIVALQKMLMKAKDIKNTINCHYQIWPVNDYIYNLYT